MSWFKVKNVNYICSGQNGKLINIDLDVLSNGIVISSINNYTLITDTEEGMTDMIKYGSYNKHSFKNKNIIIHSLFDPKDIAFKSSISKIKENNNKRKTADDYIDVYVPQLKSNLIQSSQLYGMIYTLTDKTNDGPVYKITNLKQNIVNDSRDIDNNDYKYILPTSNINTFVYGTKQERQDRPIEQQYIPKYNFYEIDYNYMMEMNVNDSECHCNHFNKGIVLTETFQTKNAYDSLYSMSMPNEYTLSCCREYCGLDNCAGELYLKYYDNIKYSKTSSSKDNDLNIIKTSKSYCDQVNKYPFQKIETFSSINRFRNNIKHKSNLYSIRINNCGLNEDIYKDKEMLNKVALIQNDIRNNIREITEKICPVETQLFDIYFDGD